MEDSSDEYTVTIRNWLNGRETVLQNVIGDGTNADTRMRWFFMSDQSRLEISIENMSFHFSKEREALVIKSQLAKEAADKSNMGKPRLV